MKKAKRQLIHEAAAKVFAEKGFHGASMQDIADALSMQKGSLYYYIDKKEDLLQGMLEEMMNELIEPAKGIVKTKYAPPEKLAHFIESHLRVFMGNLALFSIFFQERPDLLNTVTNGCIHALVQEYESYLVDILEEGKEAGDFQADLDTQVVANALFGMCNYTYRWYKPESELPIQEVARVFAQFALQGVNQSSSI